MIVGLGIIVLIKRRKSCPKKSRPRYFILLKKN
jgi:hypothetical protein